MHNCNVPMFVSGCKDGPLHFPTALQIDSVHERKPRWNKTLNSLHYIPLNLPYISPR